MLRQDFTLTLHVEAERCFGPDEIQDALETAWRWPALARVLRAASVTLRVDALAGEDAGAAAVHPSRTTAQENRS